MPKGAEARFVLAAAAIAAALAAHAETRTFYRWTDDQGRVQYSDRPPPASFKGEVTRVEVDTEVNTRATTPPRAPALPADVMKDVTPDVAKARREKRAQLEQAIRRAEAKVAAAKAALESGGDPKAGESNVIQREYAKAQPGKSNCREVPGDTGKPRIICPALTPNEQYYERQRGLEEALKQAEEELADAQLAYRRGVD